MNNIVEARIEIPMGSQNKYEIDQTTGRIKLDRVLYSSSHYPAEYGYIEKTLSEDGDSLDILVFTSSPTFPGCYIESKIIGGMHMIDNGDEDTKILAVNIGDPRYNYINTLEELPPHILKEIENFFSSYKNMQGKKTVVNNFFNTKTALEILKQSKLRYKNKNVTK